MIRYFQGISYKTSSFGGLYVIRFGHDEWYSGIYNSVKSTTFQSTKAEIIKLTNKVKRRDTKVLDWDWHHIVEGQHLAMLSVRGDIDVQYNHSIPVILIHKPEHRFFSQNFNNKEWFDLIKAAKFPAQALQAGAMELHNNEEGKIILRKRAAALKDMYDCMYAEYPALKQVAKNILNKYASEI